MCNLVVQVANLAQAKSSSVNDNDDHGGFEVDGKDELLTFTPHRHFSVNMFSLPSLIHDCPCTGAALQGCSSLSASCRLNSWTVPTGIRALASFLHNYTMVSCSYLANVCLPPPPFHPDKDVIDTTCCALAHNDIS